MKFNKIINFLVALSLFATACSDDKDKLIDFTVKQSALYLKPAQTAQLEVVPVPNTLTDVTFTFASDNSGIVSVNETGLVTANAAGKAKITITAGAYSKSLTVTVADDLIVLTDIILTPTTVNSLNVGDTVKLNAQPVPPDAIDNVFHWVSSKPDILSVSDDGTVTALQSGKAEIAVRNGTGDIFKKISIRVKTQIVFPEIWTFDDPSDLTKASSGNALINEGEIVSVDGPTADNKAMRIAKGCFLNVAHDIEANGRDNGKINNYSIMMDIKIPTTGLWYALLKTNLNGGDAVAWIDDQNKFGWNGTGGYSSTAIPTNEWHRVVLTVNDANITYYMDGVELISGDETSENTDALAIDPDGVLLFSADGGYDNVLDVAEVRLWNTTLDAAAVTALGKMPQQTTTVHGGEWLFDDPANLGKATSGVDLEIVGPVTSVDGTKAGDKAVRIPSGSYLNAVHNIAANGRNNGKVNQYTMQMDIKLPQTGLWYALYNTNLTGGDAVSWIDEGNHIGWDGTSGYSTATIPTNEWHRVVLTVNDNAITYYLDGTKILDGTEKGNQNENALALDLAGVRLFNAAGGYDNELDVSKVKIWDKTFTAEEVAALGSLAPVSVPAKAGSWLFDDNTDLTKAEIGSALTFNGDVTAVDGPSSANKAANVPIGSYINVNHGMAANGSEANGKVNEYTIMLDIKLGQAGIGTGWYSILQTQLANNGHDGVVWIDVTAGYTIGWAGTGGYSSEAVPSSDWFRLVMSVKDGEVNYYVNGALIYTGEESDSETGAMSLDPMGFLLFTDQLAGYDGEFNVSEIAVWNVALDADQAAAVGAIQNE